MPFAGCYIVTIQPPNNYNLNFYYKDCMYRLYLLDVYIVVVFNLLMRFFGCNFSFWHFGRVESLLQPLSTQVMIANELQSFTEKCHINCWEELNLKGVERDRLEQLLSDELLVEWLHKNDVVSLQRKTFTTSLTNTCRRCSNGIQTGRPSASKNTSSLLMFQTAAAAIAMLPVVLQNLKLSALAPLVSSTKTESTDNVKLNDCLYTGEIILITKKVVPYSAAEISIFIHGYGSFLVFSCSHRSRCCVYVIVCVRQCGITVCKRIEQKALSARWAG